MTTDAGAVPDKLREEVSAIRQPWVGSVYYGNAEKNTHLFWEESGFFRPFFNQLPRGAMLELASGHGRHAEKAAPLVARLILVDVIEENLAVCRARLGPFKNVEYRLGTGLGYPGCADGSLDAIYCYDAMVHFSPEIVRAYLADTMRVLRPGGRALFHHSNYAAGEGRPWSQNPSARNYMTVGLFAEMAREAGLSVVEQKVIPWGQVADLDGISLVERPVA